MATVMIDEIPVRVEANGVTLEGDLSLPEMAHGLVLFAHGSGSSRHSPRNRFVAHHLASAGLATLLMDLLTPEEEQAERYTRLLRFDIGLLAGRLIGTTDWLALERRTASLSLGYFGASTGAAAALVAAAERSERVAAIVSRGGRPDLAGNALSRVVAPTLLIVGGDDEPVIGMNEWAMTQLTTPIKELDIVPGATHLFEEPGAMEEVARLATNWFTYYLAPSEGAGHRT